MIYFSILMISNIYAQCDDYIESQCNNDTICEWIVTYQWYDCDNFSNSSQCNSYSEYGCYWDSHWYYSGWSDCDGPSFQLETGGFCQEIQMPECSEMNETECSSDNVCEWVEDIEIGQCSQFDNSENSCIGYPGECYWDEDITYGSCNGYDNSQWACNNAQGCYWDCYYGYCGCNGQEITGVDTECIGQYEINNSYCEDAEYQLGDLNLDSAINIQDVIIIINLILNGEFDLVADINLDSTVNVLDVIQLVNIILNN